MASFPTPRPRLTEVLIRKNVLAGLLFIAVAAIGLWLSRNYPVGTALRMGTGYVPRLLCWFLGGIGVIIAIQGLWDDGEGSVRGDFRWRPLVFVPLAILVFGFTVERLGIVIATLALVAVGALAGRDMRATEVAATALFLVFATVAVFIWGLGLTISLWPDW